MKMENKIKLSERLNKSFAQERELKEFCKYAKKKLFKHIVFKQHHNAIFDRTNILEVLLNGAITDSCLESASKTIKDKLTRKTPSADSILRYIAKFSEQETLLMFQRTYGYIFKLGRKLRIFNRPVDVAIDCHDIHYYGDKNDLHIVEGKPDKGTVHYFRFITINIVEKGRRFTLKALPVNKLSFRERQVEQLLTYAMKVVKIRYVYMDRGFFDNKMIRLLNHLGLKYIIRAPASPRIKKLTRKHKTLPIVIPFLLINKAYTNLVVVNMKKIESDSKKECRIYYITNIPTTDRNITSLENLYRKRWGVETSYRVKKHEFRVKTTSRNHVIRSFLFMLSVALYNLYYLCNIMVGWQSKINWITPFIPANIFISKLLHVYVPPLKLSGGYG